ncbi:helix-turn-helix domain-containing protein [Marinomonas sp. C2222]|uniref:Helix-turn-helix domain-containing protein n=1 Tax=Marinomonas sargassi TaxID=2984494 RepID=A0ABT2YPD4_9GAMM|nr:DUF6597 domain-containing transcriptional factor [Marinomonas sargassi]MCV2401743.1 helix-turn-helix domain-containing protein [Marinomonas sargassi]
MYTQKYVPFQPTLTLEGQSYFGLSIELTPPVAALADAIHAYIQVKVDTPTPYPMIPDATNVLFFSSKTSMVGGTRLSILEAQLLEPGEYFGVWFKPGMFRQFFNVDLADITQAVVDDDYLSNRHFSYLGERLYDKKGFQEKVALCDSLFLKSLLGQPLPLLSGALQLIYESFGSISVEKLADKVGISCRQLNRQFSLHTGVSTKAFSQLIKAQALLRNYYLGSESILAYGLDLGFYDQSHLSKSLKKHHVSSLSSQAQSFMSDFYKPR